MDRRIDITLKCNVIKSAKNFGEEMDKLEYYVKG